MAKSITSIYLDEATRAQLEARAYELKLSKNQIVNQALVAYLGSSEDREPVTA